MRPLVPRLPLPPGRLRVAGTLLEAGLLLSFAGMSLSGQLQAGGSDEFEEPRMPIRLGLRALPVLAVIAVYVAQRLVRPQPRAFLLAGALVVGLGSALRAGVSPLERVRDGLLGLVVGAFVTGFVMPLDGEVESLRQEGTAQPWRELLFATMLVFLGSLPAAVAGGFLVAVPTIALGLWVMGRGVVHDARRLWWGDGRTGAAARLALALPMGLMGLGLLGVTPLLSLGWQPR